jgi:hypothetical protein
MRLVRLIAAIGLSGYASIAVASAESNHAKIDPNTYIGPPVVCESSINAQNNPQIRTCSTVNPPHWAPLVPPSRHGR